MEKDMTVVIPTYNRCTILEKVFEALTYQTHPNFTVLLIDHGSTDATVEVCRKFSNRIEIDYCYVARNPLEVAIPRNIAMDRVKTRYVAFLDGDMLVPSYYVKAHVEFLKANIDTIGLGFSHGHKRPNTSWTNELTSTSIDELGIKMANDDTMCDFRLLVIKSGDARGANNGRLPWVDGWSNNLSLTTRMFKDVGGFPTDQPYGFDDLDFSYKLFRQGYKFRYVMDGWAIELPHPRPDDETLRALDARGCAVSYRRHRSLALESFLLQALGISGYGAEKTYAQLSYLGKNYKMVDFNTAGKRLDVRHPALLIGATSVEGIQFDYYARCDEAVMSTASIWSCCAIVCPLETGSLATTVIVDIWRWLDDVIDEHRSSLLEKLVHELKRTSRSCIFLKTSYKNMLAKREVSKEELNMLCTQANLSFSIVEV